MRITDILQPDCVKVPLVASTKQEAVFELVDLLCEHTPVSEAETLKEAVWARETTRTTGIGHGIGIPHGKISGCDGLRMAIGRCEPIEFGAIDGKPVELIFLLASPIDQTGPHIQALAKLSKMLVDADFRNRLKTVDATTVYRMISEMEAQLAV